MKTALNQLCVEKEGEREKGEKKKERIWRGVGVGNKEDREDEAAEAECVNDAALLRNVSNGCQFMPQVSNMVHVMVCQGSTMHCG